MAVQPPGAETDSRRESDETAQWTKPRVERGSLVGLGSATGHGIAVAAEGRVKTLDCGGVGCEVGGRVSPAACMFTGAIRDMKVLKPYGAEHLHFPRHPGHRHKFG
jgi:hypothetical protein